jgi:membrane protease YdiL (CAAX protease family)
VAAKISNMSNSDSMSPAAQIAVVIGLVLFGFVLAYLVSQLLFGSMIESVSDLDNLSRNSINKLKASQFVNQLFGFLLPSAVAAYVLKNPKWFSDFNGDLKVRPSLYILLAMAVLLPLIAYLSYLNLQFSFPDFLSNLEKVLRSLQDQLDGVVEQFVRVDTWYDIPVNILIIAVLPALAEEYLFRGNLQVYFMRMISNPHIAIWLTAFIFSAFHGQVYGILPRWVLGALLGYLYYWSGSLKYSVLAHFANNFYALVLSWAYGFSATGEEEFGDNQWLNVLIVLISTGIAWMLISRFRTESIKKSRQLQDDGILNP